MLSRLHALLRSETLFIAVTAVGGALVCAFAFVRFGFLGLAIVGLVALLITVRIELEADGPTAGPATPDVYAASLRRETGEGEALRRTAERAGLRSSLRFVRILAACLVAIGGAGFFTLQLG